MNADGRHSVNIDDKVYQRLKKHGRFGESYSDLIYRICEELEYYQRLKMDKDKDKNKEKK